MSFDASGGGETPVTQQVTPQQLVPLAQNETVAP